MREFNAELDRLMRERFYSSKTTQEFLVEAARTACRVLEVQRISVWTYVQNKQAIRCECLFDGENQPDGEGMLLYKKDFPSYFKAISMSRIVSAKQAQTDPRTSEFTETYLKPLNIHSMLDAHIPSSTEVRGVVCCESVGQSRAWTSDESAFTASLAELVGLALERAERSKTQEQLADALRAAEEAGEAKSAFLANMSHEIRTPMNGVLGMLELVLADEQDPKKRGNLKTAHNSARSLLNVLDDVLDYSRLEAGEFSLSPEPFKAKKIMEEVTSLFRAQAEAKGLSISAEIDSSVPQEIIGDHARLRQVLSNFISNAIKFTDQGQVSVSMKREANPTEDNLRIEVRDTGIGIARDSLAKLFQRFSQVDTSSTRRFGGTGLGLVICKQLIELMGGTIGVDSTEGKGSCFWVTLPIVVSNDLPPQNTPDRSDASPANSKPEYLKILAAEDNFVNQKVLQSMVESLGHQITIVGNGHEALEIIESQDFDIVLMDIQMPIMDGISATKAIRSLSSAASSIIVVALTANAMVGDRERYLAAGMNDYLAKPYQREQLVQVLERSVNLRKAGN